MYHVVSGIFREHRAQTPRTEEPPPQPPPNEDQHIDHASFNNLDEALLFSYRIAETHCLRLTYTDNIPYFAVEITKDDNYELTNIVGGYVVHEPSDTCFLSIVIQRPPSPSTPVKHPNAS